MNQRDIEKIARDLGTTAHDVQQAAQGRPTRGGIARQLIDWLGSIFSPKRGPAKSEPPPPSQPASTQASQPRRQAPGFGKLAQEIPRGSEEVFTPQSSNVYSFRYSSVDEILWVTFKAQEFHPGALTTGQATIGGRRSQMQAIGRRGRTIKGGRRPNSPGVTYFYANVKAAGFEAFRQAAMSSAGKAVWDHLRIRRTVYGHRYQYGVTGGQLLPNGQSYIPRKATANGFRTRSLRVINSREFQTSTIPASRSGFRTRRPG